MVKCLIKMNKREYKKQQLVNLSFLIGSLILINFFSNIVFMRLDLTADKRYTLSSATYDVLEQVDDIIHIRVYLDGDLPVGFRRMRTAVREMLDEFRVVAKMNIHYEFIDPSDIDDKECAMNFSGNFTTRV
jgi:ABC-2 type transport system permease protein